MLFELSVYLVNFFSFMRLFSVTGRGFWLFDSFPFPEGDFGYSSRFRFRKGILAIRVVSVPGRGFWLSCLFSLPEGLGEGVFAQSCDARGPPPQTPPPKGTPRWRCAQRSAIASLIGTGGTFRSVPFGTGAFCFVPVGTGGRFVLSQLGQGTFCFVSIWPLYHFFG